MPFLDLSDDFKPFYRLDDHTDPWLPAPTVLFVHGFCESTDAWNAWVPYLSRHYRMIRYDLRGFGQTAAVASDFRYTTDLFVDDQVRIINHLANGPVHVVSSKSGGISAIRLAAQRPDLVRSLTLTSAPVLPPEADDWLPHMEKFGIRSWARGTMRARLGADVPERCIDWWVDLMGSTSLSTAHAYLRWVAQADVRSDLPRVSCPTLIITTQAPMRTDDETRCLQQIPHNQLKVLPLDGYHAAGTDPDSCALATRDFLDALNPR